MADDIKSAQIICSGGLNSNENNLALSESSPGGASRLINYEPSMFGGYRRVEGYRELDNNLGEVGQTGVTAEGKVLGVFIYRNEHIGNPYFIAARKDHASNTYSFYKYVFFAGWQVMATGLPATALEVTKSGRTVEKIRAAQWNFGDGSHIAFVDGVNNCTVFDGVNWKQINPTGAGTAADPGGPQALAAPSVVEVFEKSIFLSGDSAFGPIVAYSAAADWYDFTAANAGQLVAGFSIVNIKPFRNNLFLFGNNDIKKVVPDSTFAFLVENVTNNVGCIAKDSVVEIGGDLMFLSPDGLRPVAGTSKIGDVELQTLSKPIQGKLVDIIKNYDMDTVNSVVIRSKSQVRLFYGDDDDEPSESMGIIGALSANNAQIGWEFGELQGIRCSCCTSGYVGRIEYILHGDYDGKVYQQEYGTSFNGSDIISIYSTPYIDFGDTEERKVMRKINTFVRAEGPFELLLSVQFDWGDVNVARPSTYTQESEGQPVIYNGRNINYVVGNGTSNIIFGGASKPIMTTDVQGSGFSARASYVSIGQTQPHSIQGLVFEYSVAGRR